MSAAADAMHAEVEQPALETPREGPAKEKRRKKAGRSRRGSAPSGLRQLFDWVGLNDPTGGDGESWGGQFQTFAANALSAVNGDGLAISSTRRRSSFAGLVDGRSVARLSLGNLGGAATSRRKSCGGAANPLVAALRNRGGAELPERPAELEEEAPDGTNDEAKSTSPPTTPEARTSSTPMSSRLSSVQAGSLVSLTREFINRGLPQGFSVPSQQEKASEDVAETSAARLLEREVEDFRGAYSLRKQDVRFLEVADAGDVAGMVGSAPGSAQVVTLAFRGVQISIDLVLLPGEQKDGGAASMPLPVVLGASTSCGWTAARQALAETVEALLVHGQTRSVTEFLHLLVRLWPGPEAKRSSPGKRHASQPAPAARRQEAPQAVQEGISTSTPASAVSNARQARRSLVPGSRSESFACWLETRQPLWRFDGGSAGLGWDHPTSKAEKRELLLLNIMAEEAERRNELGSLMRRVEQEAVAKQRRMRTSISSAASSN
eukprot:TRINITY_DN94159_c0_g1_i1.p1 TRINITY_DN94159_c0_g1~~TRINITY_DN94159_c0_g1_i1.p1  ORF type:complete len:492 (-),score=97.22 TRINITY_DN94159_c0_g1_i1:190-1665(-)